MGAVVGAIASGNVPAGGNGDAFSSWMQPLPLLTGAMFVATGAYLSAVFLVGDARRAGEAELERYFVAPRPRRRGGRRRRRRLRPGRAARRSALHLRPPRRPGTAAGDPLGALRRRPAGGAAAGRAAPAAPARRRRRRRRDLGLGRRPVPLPAADLPDDRAGAAAPDATLDVVFVVFVDRRGPRPALAGPALRRSASATCSSTTARGPCDDGRIKRSSSTSTAPCWSPAAPARSPGSAPSASCTGSTPTSRSTPTPA